MIARRCVAALVVPTVLLAACTSSGDKQGPTTSPPGSGTATSPAAQLADKVRHGVEGLKSAHLDVDAAVLGQKITGDVMFADGRTTASDLTIDQVGTVVEVITVGTTSYAKLPGAQNTSGKPWVQVSATSGNEYVRALAGTLTLTTAATSIGSLTGLLGTATTSVKDSGSEQVGGVTAEHYALTIDPTKATGDIADALSAAGKDPLPVDLWLDAQDRPVQIKIAVPFGQQSFPLLVKVSKFDAPLDISAPPPDQVSTS